MSFASYNLRPASLKALAAADITTPTPIQAQSLPVLLAGHDIIGEAHTGSGKTLAFALPLIEHCDPEKDVTQALILTPTRELAQQVASVLDDVGAASGFRVVVVHGGVGYGPQDDALRGGAQIVVGTPGRLLDHLQRRTLNTSAVSYLVLDEADQMLDQGFAPDVERILSRVPASRQTALFSATAPDWVQRVSAKYMHEPRVVRVEDSEPDIDHSVIEAWSGDKFPVLLALLEEECPGATLVFGRTKHGVENLARRLQRMGFEVEALQGNLSQAARDRIVDRFRSGRVPVLLATNVAARGLDMLNIERVINYDLPDTPELFVHRVGRTGRVGRSGRAITIIAATDLLKMREIERWLGRRLPRAKAPERVLPPERRTTAVHAAPPRPRLVEAAVPTKAAVETVIAEDNAGEGQSSRTRRRRRRGPRRQNAQQPTQATGEAVASA